MENCKIKRLTKWLARKSSRPFQSDSKNDSPFNIGCVQSFEQLLHVTKDAEGELKGEPEDFQKMRQRMIAAKERENAKNTETAKQIIVWNAELQKKNQEKAYKEIQLVDSDSSQNGEIIDNGAEPEFRDSSTGQSQPSAPRITAKDGHCSKRDI